MEYFGVRDPGTTQVNIQEGKKRVDRPLNLEEKTPGKPCYSCTAIEDYLHLSRSGLFTLIWKSPRIYIT
jgi:hypothetical protein